MATQETQLQLLIGQGDSDSDIGRPAASPPGAPPPGRRATDALGAPACPRPGPPPTPREDGRTRIPFHRRVAGTRNRPVALRCRSNERASAPPRGPPGHPTTRDHDQREDHPCSTVRATAHVNTMHRPTGGPSAATTAATARRRRASGATARGTATTSTARRATVSVPREPRAQK